MKQSLYKLITVVLLLGISPLLFAPRPKSVEEAITNLYASGKSDAADAYVEMDSIYTRPLDRIAKASETDIKKWSDQTGEFGARMLAHDDDENIQFLQEDLAKKRATSAFEAANQARYARRKLAALPPRETTPTATSPFLGAPVTARAVSVAPAPTSAIERFRRPSMRSSTPQLIPLAAPITVDDTGRGSAIATPADADSDLQAFSTWARSHPNPNYQALGDAAHRLVVALRSETPDFKEANAAMYDFTKAHNALGQPNMNVGEIAFFQQALKQKLKPLQEGLHDYQETVRLNARIGRSTEDDNNRAPSLIDFYKGGLRFVTKKPVMPGMPSIARTVPLEPPVNPITATLNALRRNPVTKTLGLTTKFGDATALMAIVEDHPASAESFTHYRKATSLHAELDSAATELRSSGHAELANHVDMLAAHLAGTFNAPATKRQVEASRALFIQAKAEATTAPPPTLRAPAPITASPVSQPPTLRPPTPRRLTALPSRLMMPDTSGDTEIARRLHEELNSSARRSPRSGRASSAHRGPVRVPHPAPRS